MFPFKLERQYVIQGLDSAQIPGAIEDEILSALHRALESSDLVPRIEGNSVTARFTLLQWSISPTTLAGVGTLKARIIRRRKDEVELQVEGSLPSNVAFVLGAGILGGLIALGPASGEAIPTFVLVFTVLGGAPTGLLWWLTSSAVERYVDTAISQVDGVELIGDDA